MSRRRHLLALASALTIGGIACGDDSVEPSAVACTYTATSFRVIENGATTDILSAGGTVTLQLSASGTTSGRIHIPAIGTQPVFDADLAGTWSIEDGTVRLQHTADTFLRDMIFDFDDDELIGDRTFGAARIVIELTKS